MSEKTSSSRSRTCMHLKKVSFSSSFRQLETQFSHEQGHQGTIATLGSVKITQSTNITVYEVESQKTNNAKVSVWTNRFSEVVKGIFRHNVRES